MTQYKATVTVDPTTSIEIGQDAAIVEEGLSLLEKDGAVVLEAYLLTLCPPAIAAVLGAPIIGLVFKFIIAKMVTFIVGEVDKVAFALYVSIRTAKQVSDYVTAEELGQKAAIDSAGDNLINLGDE